MSLIKNQIDAEAKKAADAIRAALEEFSKETGLAAQVNVRWLEMSFMSERAGRVVLDGVSVRPARPSSTSLRTATRCGPFLCASLCLKKRTQTRKFWLSRI